MAPLGGVLETADVGVVLREGPAAPVVPRDAGRDVERVRDGVETEGRIAISGAGATGPVFIEPRRSPEPPTKWYVLPKPDGCGREGGADGEGIGSTDDCRCKYTPSCSPLSLPSFLRTT